MSLSGGIIGLCFLPLIIVLALDQSLHLSEFFLLFCRQIASFRVVRALLSACFDHLRASQECDVAGSFPGSPFLLATILEHDIPHDAKRLESFQYDLKKKFYRIQRKAGRISHAQYLTFLNRPEAIAQHEKEDAEFAERYQATMAAYEVVPRVETNREWVRRMREEHEAADLDTQQVQSSAGAAPGSCTRPARSQKPYQGSAHAHALALISDMPPPAPPKFKALRGLAPRDSKGNIMWGPDPAYEAYLIQEARARQPPQGIVYRRWDSFALTPNEKIHFNMLKVTDRLNLWSYSVKHWKEDIFQIHPPDNRSVFIDMQDGSYHELWEYDYVNNIALWRIITAIGGYGGLSGLGSSGSNTNLFGSSTVNAGGFGAAPTNVGSAWGAGAQPVPPVNTTTTNNIGVFGAPIPPGKPGSLFGSKPPKSTGGLPPISDLFNDTKPTSNAGGEAGGQTQNTAPGQTTANPFPPAGSSNTGGDSTNTSDTQQSAGNPFAGSNIFSNLPNPNTSAKSERVFSDDNPLKGMSKTPQIKKLEKLMDEVTALWATFDKDRVVADCSIPREAKEWEYQCGEAAKRLRWIAEAVTKPGSEPRAWNNAYMKYQKASEIGFMSPWLANMHSELQRMMADRQASSQFPFFRSVWIQANEIVLLTKGIAQ